MALIALHGGTQVYIGIVIYVGIDQSRIMFMNISNHVHEIKLLCY
jgi:hypothetical protein